MHTVKSEQTGLQRCIWPSTLHFREWPGCKLAPCGAKEPSTSRRRSCAQSYWVSSKWKRALVPLGKSGWLSHLWNLCHFICHKPEWLLILSCLSREPSWNKTEAARTWSSETWAPWACGFVWSSRNTRCRQWARQTIPGLASLRRSFALPIGPSLCCWFPFIY